MVFLPGGLPCRMVHAMRFCWCFLSRQGAARHSKAGFFVANFSAVTARAFVRVDTARFECRAAPRQRKEGFHPFCESKID